MATPWFAGVCDTLLARIQTWESKYELGEVYATRKYLTKKFEKMDLPVQFRHQIPFSKPEMQHLVRILKAERPKSDITDLFDKILAIMNNPSVWLRHKERMIVDKSGRFILALTCEKFEITEIKNILEAVKAGRSTIAVSLDGLLAAKKKAGKGMWEN